MPLHGPIVRGFRFGGLGTSPTKPQLIPSPELGAPTELNHTGGEGREEAPHKARFRRSRSRPRETEQSKSPPFSAVRSALNYSASLSGIPVLALVLASPSPLILAPKARQSCPRLIFSPLPARRDRPALPSPARAGTCPWFSFLHGLVCLCFCLVVLALASSQLDDAKRPGTSLSEVTASASYENRLRRGTFQS